LVDREVPGRERRDRTHRLPQRELVDALRPGRDHPAVGAPGLLGKPIDDVRPGERLGPCLRQRLALFHRHQRRDLVGPAAQQVSGPAHELGAVEGRNPPPGRETALSRRQGEIEVGPLRMGDEAVGLASRRVHDGQRLARLGAGPFPVDMQQYVGVFHGRVPFVVSHDYAR